MSDDDFFDSPAGGESAPKKYSFGKSEKISASVVSTGGDSQGVRRDNSSYFDDDATSLPKDAKPSSSSKQVMKIPTAGRQQRRHSSSSGTGSDQSSRSDSEYSDSETEGDTTRRSPRAARSSRRSARSSSSRSSSRSRSRTPENTDKGGQKQAWGVDSVVEGPAPGSRPKTGHHRRRQQRSPRSCSNRERDQKSRSPDRNSDRSSSVSDSETTDSDITDVSPLNSPSRYTPKSSPKKTKRVEIMESVSDRRPPHSPMHKDLYNYGSVDHKKNRPKSANCNALEGYQHLLAADKDSVNLKVLMQAILDMEQEREEQYHRDQHKKFKVPSSPHAPSIAGSVSSQCSFGSKKNYSFSNSRVKDIDRENQRLMNRILQQNAKPKKKPSTEKRKPMTASHKISSSAVNRLREQQRIDQENRSMLKRLEGAKATKTLVRDEINRELYNTTYVGVPLGIIHAQKPRSHSHSSKTSPYSSRPSSAPPRRPRSATRSDAGSVVSEATSVATSSSTIRSQKSGGSRPRPKSAHTFGGARTFKVKKPEWETGW